MSNYRVILADPPWEYKDRCNAGKRGASHKYACMSVDKIAALRVRDVADATGCLLAMWWTGPMAREALHVVDAWGFEFKNACGFTWVKRTKLWKWHWGMGHLTRANTENCLFATLGKVRRVDAGVHQLIEARVREHSRKPDEAALRLERLCGDVPRLEMFARAPRRNWDVWGLEVESTVEIANATLTATP